MVFKIIFATLFFSLFYAAGIATLLSGIEEVQFGRAVAAWPTVAAHLETCTVALQPSAEANVYRAAAKYTYSVAGRHYSGDMIAVSYWGTSDPEEHEAICRQVAGMAPLLVRYFPAKPGISVLLAPKPAWMVMKLAIGVIWLLFVTAFVAVFPVGNDGERMLITWVREKFARRRTGSDTASGPPAGAI